MHRSAVTSCYRLLCSVESKGIFTIVRKNLSDLSVTSISAHLRNKKLA